MSGLLDTHAFVWWLLDDPRLSSNARAAIEGFDAPCLISAVTAFEITNKVRNGKFAAAAEIAEKFHELVAECGFVPLPVTVAHGHRAGTMEGEHRDPFDRLLAAQSLEENVPLITSDRAFKLFGVKTVW